MAIVHMSTAAVNAQAAVISGLIDAGAGAGKIKIYSGAMPSTPEDTPAGDLLVTLVFADPSFGSPADGVIVADAIAAVAADATGTAAFARLTDSSDNPVMDIDVGTADTAIILNTVAFIEDVDVEITSLSITLPQS